MHVARCKREQSLRSFVLSQHCFRSRRARFRRIETLQVNLAAFVRELTTLTRNINNGSATASLSRHRYASWQEADLSVRIPRRRSRAFFEIAPVSCESIARNVQQTGLNVVAHRLSRGWIRYMIHVSRMFSRFPQPPPCAEGVGNFHVRTAPPAPTPSLYRDDVLRCVKYYGSSIGRCLQARKRSRP